MDLFVLVNAGAALYTAYRDSDTIFNSSDLVSGLFEYMRKGGGTGSIEVRHGGVAHAGGLLLGRATGRTVGQQLVNMASLKHATMGYSAAAGVTAAEEC
jgi:hypothetical protein